MNNELSILKKYMLQNGFIDIPKENFNLIIFNSLGISSIEYNPDEEGISDAILDICGIRGYLIATKQGFIKIGEEHISDDDLKMDSTRLKQRYQDIGDYYQYFIDLNKLIFNDDDSALERLMAGGDERMLSDIVMLFQYEKNDKLLDFILRRFSSRDVFLRYSDVVIRLMLLYNNRPLALREKVIKMLSNINPQIITWKLFEF